MENYIVYKHIFPNGKIYIGVTRRAPEIRWGANGNNYRNNSKMWAAIKECGWDNVEHIILYENKTREEAGEIERRLIKECKSNQKEFGYNIQSGGIFGTSSYFDEDLMVKLFEEGKNLQNITQEVGCCSRTTSEILRKRGIKGKEIIRRGYILTANKNQIPQEIKANIITLFKNSKKLSEIGKELNISYTTIKKTLAENKITPEDIKNNYCIITSNNKFFIKNLVNEGKTIKDIANIFHCSNGTVKNFIKKYSPDLLNKIRENRFSKTAKDNSIAIKQYTLLGEYIKTFPSISAALRELDKALNDAHISQCCKKERNTTYGFIWRYANDTTEILPVSPSKSNSPVLQYDLQGNYIQRFDTIHNAAKLIGAKSSSISRVCRGLRKSSGGYMWKYAD